MTLRSKRGLTALIGAGVVAGFASVALVPEAVAAGPGTAKESRVSPDGSAPSGGAP